MKRRSFLKFSATVTGLGLAAGARPGAAAGIASPAAGQATGPLLPSLDAMRRIGRLHLDARPDEIDAARALRTRIDAAGGLDRVVLRRVLGEDMRRNLDQHDVVTIEGWVLPRALVRVCAAVAVA
ncbi:hypothetical protein [Arenibaculum pallidiluteum]|uniref:hypothetical protein n=1 Tax=Arenibaculum pallidiluteum TaxID=2812559 RepID=UPI001A9698DB|nr:hypothetical protein [Arenibaculum pallidiluteum]